MDVENIEKSRDQMDNILTTIQQMGKFPEFFEFTELPPSAFAFGSSNIVVSSNLSESPNYNLPHSTVSMNNAATDTAEPPCFPPYSAAGRWRSHVAATDTKQNSMAIMREMIYRIAAMQPIYIDPESVKPPKRRNVKISKDPQSIAARHRRERISERIRILQRIVPGGTKMDIASMLDEAIHYVKFLKNQVQSLEIVAAAAVATRPSAFGFPAGGGSSYKQFQTAQSGHGHVEDA